MFNWNKAVILAVIAEKSPFLSEICTCIFDGVVISSNSTPIFSNKKACHCINTVFRSCFFSLNRTHGKQTVNFINERFGWTSCSSVRLLSPGDTRTFDWHRHGSASPAQAASEGTEGDRKLRRQAFTIKASFLSANLRRPKWLILPRPYGAAALKIVLYP